MDRNDDVRGADLPLWLDWTLRCIAALFLGIAFCIYAAALAVAAVVLLPRALVRAALGHTTRTGGPELGLSEPPAYAECMRR